MTEINPDYIKLDKDMSGRGLDTAPIALLEKIKREGRAWRDLSERYGVDNPDPPWRVNLESTCDHLAYGRQSPLNACATDEPQKIDAVERRWEEDQLADELYADVPFPERALLALAHTMIRRGILSEDELARQMKKVSDRLNMVDGAYRDE